MNDERVPLTKEGFDKIRAEVNHLKSKERPQVVKEVETAAAHGDLSENAEYHAAKEKLGHIDGRISQLESVLAVADVIDPKQIADKEKVFFGATVTLLDIDSEEETSYTIVGEYESDIPQSKISVKSPIAKSLLGKKVEDEVKVKTPKGIREFEVISIKY